MQIGLHKKLEPETSVALAYLRNQPPRGDGVGVDQLEPVATELAREHEVSTGVGHHWNLQPPFQADRASLGTIYNAFVVALQAGHELAPAADRFVKRFQLVDEQLQIIGKRLTWRFYHDLPMLARGSLAGYPRIYAIALSAGSNFNGNLSAETLKYFLSAYQRINPLAIREIRAFDLTFRIVLVRKIKQLAERIAEVQAEFKKTERKLSELDHDELRSELDNAIADAISLSKLDWQKFFETVSVVDEIFAQDPASVYSSMDFASEDRYRRVVERLARRTETDELEVARRALNLASEVSPEDRCERRHIGYYLIDDGLPKLEKALNYHPGLTERFARFARQHSTTFYLSAHALITAAIVAACVLYAVRGGTSLSALIVVALLSLIPSSEIASLTLKVSLKYIFRPVSLPKLDTSLGIPDEAKTIVVMSCIFSSPAQAKESLETIQAHYLANQDSNIFFRSAGRLESRGERRNAGRRCFAGSRA